MSLGRRRLLFLACILLGLALILLAASQTPMLRRQALIWAEERLGEALGREVRIEEVRLRPWLGRLELRRVHVARGERLAEGELLSAEAIQARWSWSALFRRQLLLRQVWLTRPRLALAEDGGGGLSVEELFSVLVQPQTLSAGRWKFRLWRAGITQGQLSWHEADGAQGTLEDLEGELIWSGGPAEAPAVSGTARARRLRLTRGDTIRELTGIAVRVAGTAEGLSITGAEFAVAGAKVTARGRIADPAGAARLDLRLGLQAPLEALLLWLGSSRRMDGSLTLDGRVEGDWGQPAFQGEGALQLGKAPHKGKPLRFSLRWERDRLEAEAAGAPLEGEGVLRGRLTLEPATGLYRVRADVANMELPRLAGLLEAARTVVPFVASGPLPARGRVSGDVDLTGQGADLGALRGRASFRVDALALADESPTGRLEARVSATPVRLEVETFSLKHLGGEIQGRGSLSFASGQLDLAVRADLRDVSALGRGLGLPFLGGRATFQGRLAGRRDTPRLQGRFTWREARIAGHAFDLAEGDVEIASRSLRSSRLRLRIGGTTATLRGSVSASGAAPLARLNAKRDLSLDLQGQVNPGRTADLVAFLPEELEVQGRFRASGRITGTPQALSGEVELALENVRTWDETWERGEALLRLQRGAVEISRLALRRGEEQLTGEVRMGADGSLGGRLASTPMDLARVASLSGSDLTGRASFRLELQGTLRDTRTLGQATASVLFYRGLPLGAGTATFKIEGKAIAVDLTFRQGTHHLQASIGPPPDRSLKADLTLREGDLELVAQVADNETLRAWQARGSGRILVRGPAAAPLAGTGEVDFASLRLRIGGESWESRGPVRAAWSGTTFTVRQLRLRSGEREVDVRGTLGEENQTDLQVSGQLPLVTLAGYLPAMSPQDGLVKANLRVRGSRSAPEFLGPLEIQQGRISLSGIPAEFLDVHAGLELQGQRTEIQRWEARLAEGSFRGAGELRRQGERWKLRLTFQEDRGRAEQLLAGLLAGKETDQVTGSLSLGGLLTSQGEATADFWRSLEGDLRLVMRDGRIGRYTVLARVLTLLNVAQLLDLKLPEAFAAGGMPYQGLTADIKIHQGIAQTENLILDSQAMKMNAVGQVNLVEETVDLTVAVKPLQTVDRILAKIPLAGWLLGGKEQSLLVAYFQVSGPLHDPQVTPIPLRSVGRNVFGIFRRLLEIPEALIGPLEDLPPQPVKPSGGEGR